MMDPVFFCPTTPGSSRDPLRFRPLNSSPLVSSPSPAKSSPSFQAQSRRKSQYKSNYVPSTPSRSGGSQRTTSLSLSRASSTDSPSFSNNTSEANSQKAFLRERFRARCFERAAQARKKAISTKRYGGSFQPSSDDFMDDDEEEEDDETVMQDELFRRIMANAKRKEDYSYRVSFAQEVGSSFDPAMEDVGAWEQALTASNSANPHGASTSQTSMDPWPEEDFASTDLDDQELQAYAEEWAEIAAAADFEDIPVEELFGADFEEEIASFTSTPKELQELHTQDDNAMDMS